MPSDLADPRDEQPDARTIRRYIRQCRRPISDLEDPRDRVSDEQAEDALRRLAGKKAGEKARKEER